MRDVTRTEWLVLQGDVRACIATSIGLNVAAQRLRSVAVEERIRIENDRLSRTDARSIETR